MSRSLANLRALRAIEVPRGNLPARPSRFVRFGLSLDWPLSGEARSAAPSPVAEFCRIERRHCVSWSSSSRNPRTAPSSNPAHSAFSQLTSKSSSAAWPGTLCSSFAGVSVDRATRFPERPCVQWPSFRTCRWQSSVSEGVVANGRRAGVRERGYGTATVTLVAVCIDDDIFVLIVEVWSVVGVAGVAKVVRRPCGLTRVSGPAIVLDSTTMEACVVCRERI